MDVDQYLANVCTSISSKPLEVTEIGKYTIHKPSIGGLIDNCHFDSMYKKEDFYNFTVSAFTQIRLAFAPLRRMMTTNEVVNEVDDLNGVELAQIGGLLAFGADSKWWDIQKTVPFICLGSKAIVRCEEVCPCIYGRGLRELVKPPYLRQWGHKSHVLLKLV